MNNVRNSTKKATPILVAIAITATQILPAHSAINLTDGDSSPVQASSTQMEVALLIPRSPAFVPNVDLVEPVFSSSATAGVTKVLDRASRECRSVAAEYRADCTAKAYKRAARAANRPDYAKARAILNKASRDLSKLVSSNADRSAPTLKSGRNRYKAVKKAVVKKVARQATKIISETQTKLLRSSGSGLRKTHYQRIAKAVGSTKVIFRS